MNKKILLLDMDGVVIKKVKVFSIRFSEKYNIPIDDIVYFFKNEFQLCLIGKADLKIEIAKYFDRWNYKDGVDSLLKFWFECENEVDQNLIEKISLLTKEGYKAYLATNNEKYRVEYLWGEVGLKKYFDGVFPSAEIGFKKPDPEFYLKVLRILKATPENVLFFDDDEENVESARKVGMDSHLYSGIEDFKVV